MPFCLLKKKISGKVYKSALCKYLVLNHTFSMVHDKPLKDLTLNDVPRTTFHLLSDDKSLSELLK